MNTGRKGLTNESNLRVKEKKNVRFVSLKQAGIHQNRGAKRENHPVSVDSCGVLILPERGKVLQGNAARHALGKQGRASQWWEYLGVTFPAIRGETLTLSEKLQTKKRILMGGNNYIEEPPRGLLRVCKLAPWGSVRMPESVASSRGEVRWKEVRI